MPLHVQQQLCNKLSDRNCNEEQQLHYSHYFKLDNDALLLFFHLYKKNSLNPHGSLNAPIIVDIDGKWKSIQGYMNDEIQEILRDPSNGIWLHTVSTRRSGYSSLHYSRNGLSWQKIKLPSIRTFQTLKLCFQKNELILTFQRVENDNVKAWITTYDDAFAEEPSWRLMEKNELYQKVCQKTSPYNNAWEYKKLKGLNILFKHKYQNRIIVFPKKSTTDKIAPKTLPKKVPTNVSNPINIVPLTGESNSMLYKPYSIQLGTFNYKTSLPLIYKEFKAFKNKLITREILKNGKIQYKVFLDSFVSRKMGHQRLNILKEQYIHSKILKSAFVTKLP
jgi:hypothetical protein